MTDEKDMAELYGPLFPHSDYKRGDHIRYRAYDGTIRSGEIIWVLEPGRTVKTHKPITAQYVVEPDNPAGTMGFEFVNFGDVQTS